MAEAVKDKKIEICGVGATGSARTLTGVIVRADTVKNEITACSGSFSFSARCADSFGNWRAD